MVRRLLRTGLFLVCAAVPAAAQPIEPGPPPGSLVDLGGRRLHLQCSGSGSPTVVIEAGASSFAIDFALVQPELAKTTRTCAYDRAGSGWSDAGKEIETPHRIVRDLRALLDTAGEKPPYVMVGASRGGLLVRLFQAEYPADVAGLVLIDPSSEDRLFTLYEGKAVPIATLTAEQYRSVLPSAPVPVQTRPPQTGPPFDRLPPPLYETRVALDRRLIASMPATVSVEVVAEYNEGDRAALARLAAARTASPAVLGELPVIVLTRGRGSSPDLQASHAQLSRLSRNSRHLVVADAYHEIHLSHPDVVVRSVGDVVAAARQKSSLPAR